MKKTIEVHACDTPGCEAQTSYNCMACNADVCEPHLQWARHHFPVDSMFTFDIDLAVCPKCLKDESWTEPVKAVILSVVTPMLTRMVGPRGWEIRVTKAGSEGKWQFSREHVARALMELGVISANKEDFPRRWSVTDLATDLYPLLQNKVPSILVHYELEQPLGSVKPIPHSVVAAALKYLGITSAHSLKNASCGGHISTSQLASDLAPLLLVREVEADGQREMEAAAVVIEAEGTTGSAVIPDLAAKARHIEILGRAYQYLTGYHQDLLGSWGVKPVQMAVSAGNIRDILERLEVNSSHKYVTCGNQDPDAGQH